MLLCIFRNLISESDPFVLYVDGSQNLMRERVCIFVQNAFEEVVHALLAATLEAMRERDDRELPVQRA